MVITLIYCYVFYTSLHTIILTYLIIEITKSQQHRHVHNYTAVSASIALLDKNGAFITMGQINEKEERKKNKVRKRGQERMYVGF